jgi:RimJ/RimL family protein N-acetyltransferase
MDGLVAKVRKIRQNPRIAPSVELVSVYRLPKSAPELLYRLLEQREPHVSISHRGMPTWKHHIRFVASRPYSAWYLIRWRQDYVGAIYLTALGEIGVGVLAQWRGQGVARAAVRTLMRKHRRNRFLANINPDNEEWAGMFRLLNFRLIQHTYEYRPSRLAGKRG